MRYYILYCCDGDYDRSNADARIWKFANSITEEKIEDAVYDAKEHYNTYSENDDTNNEPEGSIYANCDFEGEFVRAALYDLGGEEIGPDGEIDW